MSWSDSGGSRGSGGVGSARGSSFGRGVRDGCC